MIVQQRNEEKSETYNLNYKRSQKFRVNDYQYLYLAFRYLWYWYLVSYTRYTCGRGQYCMNPYSNTIPERNGLGRITERVR